MAKHRQQDNRKPLQLLVAGVILAEAWMTLAAGTVRAAVTSTELRTGPIKFSSQPPVTVRASRAAYRKPLPPIAAVPRWKTAVDAALGKLGVPYVWGAKGPNVFDCSGLTQWAWRQAGIQLGPDTYTQIKQGVPVPPSQIRAGDLIFPADHHVQLAISATQVVEAPGRGMVVRIHALPKSFVARRIQK